MFKRIFLTLLFVSGLAFIIFKPNDAKALWTTINLRIKTVLEGNQTEYTPPKGYFFDTPLQIFRWVEPGKVLELSDYSQWEIEAEVPGWGISHEVAVTYSTDPNWPYTLENTDRPSRTHARYRGTTK
jgi:hypothetical protein